MAFRIKITHPSIQNYKPPNLEIKEDPKKVKELEKDKKSKPPSKTSGSMVIHQTSGITEDFY